MVKPYTPKDFLNSSQLIKGYVKSLESNSKLRVVMPLFIAFAFLVGIIPSTAILISYNSYFGTINFVYGQPDQINSNNNITNSSSLNIQNIPVKKSM